MDAVLRLDFNTAIPGHGPLITKAQVQIFRDKLGTLQQRMSELIKSGGKKEDVAKVKIDDLNWPLQQRALENVYTDTGGK